ncbi:MAG: hypothetical protein V1705_00845 [bacterium]
MKKYIFSGLTAGVLGGMIIDLIFINLAGPSALFTIIGITERINVFISHAVLGGILGIIFTVLVRKLPRLNIWLAGILWGLVCLGVIGGIPSFFVKLVNPLTALFGFIVWLIYGLILAAAMKFFSQKV